MADINIGSIDDSLSLSEDLIPCLEVCPGINDSITIAEDIIILLDLNSSINDASSLTESVNSALAHTISLNDTSALTESTSGYSFTSYPSTSVSNDNYASATIYAANFFTEAVVPMKTKTSKGFLNVSVEGTFVGTVTLQRSFDKGATWYDYDSWTAVTEEFIYDFELGVRYRIGCKTGGYTSGGMIVRISTGP